MAMSREQQRAAAERILAKHPLTKEEERLYKMLVKSPDEYGFPREKRVCGNCGMVFEDTVAKGEIKVTALDKFSDHQSEHNPSGAQWAEAYSRIHASNQKATP